MTNKNLLETIDQEETQFILLDESDLPFYGTHQSILEWIYYGYDVQYLLDNALLIEAVDLNLEGV